MKTDHYITWTHDGDVIDGTLTCTGIACRANDVAHEPWSSGMLKRACTPKSEWKFGEKCGCGVEIKDTGSCMYQDEQDYIGVSGFIEMFGGSTPAPVRNGFVKFTWDSYCEGHTWEYAGMSGVARIEAERQKQIAKGYTLEHDIEGGLHHLLEESARRLRVVNRAHSLGSVGVMRQQEITEAAAILAALLDAVEG